MVRVSLAFSYTQPGIMKMIGTNTGRRRKNSAMDRFLMVMAENS